MGSGGSGVEGWSCLLLLVAWGALVLEMKSHRGSVSKRGVPGGI